MNTVKKGDEFEDQSHDIIEKILNSGELSLIPSHCMDILMKFGQLVKQLY